MAYTNNPQLPRVRMDAVRFVRAGHSTREAAVHFGYTQSAIVKWMQRAPSGGAHLIPTKSSRPLHHPDELSAELVLKIVEYRKQYRRGPEVLQVLLARDGYLVSLSSIKRTLRRNGLVNHSPWKKWHQYPERPLPTEPGILVELDTIHDGAPGSKDHLYIYTLLDVFSRWAFAVPVLRIGAGPSLSFVRRAKDTAPFRFQTLQSDHGSEFSKYFTKNVGISHRHTRLRRPTDNGHLERFNRTIQEECLNQVPRKLDAYTKAIPEYLEWYNNRRPHMALEMKSPIDMLK